MELKPGYKETDVGVIPSSWDVRTLADLSRKITDGDHATPRRTDHGYYLLSARNVLDGQIDVSDVDFVGPDEYLRMKQRCDPEAGDILISCSGTIGRVTVVPHGFECVLVRSAALAKIDTRVASSSFIQYWLQGNQAQAQIFSRVNQGAQPNLFLNHIERLQCPLPPLVEQEAIAAALCDVDMLLGALDRLIAKKRDLKSATMQQLLTGQTRLPGFSGRWETRRVSDMGEVLAGKALDAHGAGRLRPYLRTKNVLDGRIDLEDVLEMPMTDVEFQRFRVKRGDVLLNEGQSFELVGRCSLYRGELSVPCAMQNQLLRFRAGTCTSSAFAEHLFRRCQHTGVFSSIATQTTSVAHLGSSRFSHLQLLWPIDRAEQDAIATVLSNMDAELAALQQCRDKTGLLKQGMMQELLTGRTRLL